MLAWCLTMLRREMKLRPSSSAVERWGTSRIARNGMETAARTEPSETKRVVATMRAKTATDARATRGTRAMKTPSAVAIPLPPLKPSQMGKT